MSTLKVNQYLDDMLMYADIGNQPEFDQMDRGFQAMLGKELSKKHPWIPNYIKMRNKLRSSFTAQSVEWKESCRRTVYDFLKEKVKD